MSPLYPIDFGILAKSKEMIRKEGKASVGHAKAIHQIHMVCHDPPCRHNKVNNISKTKESLKHIRNEKKTSLSL
ncbi:hypothetical protein QQP08_019500 [Theobroma cacao]|nr:hypothetical protein QQP08_019500 [Theobroma cacao]